MSEISARWEDVVREIGSQPIPATPEIDAAEAEALDMIERTYNADGSLPSGDANEWARAAVRAAVAEARRYLDNDALTHTVRDARKPERYINVSEYYDLTQSECVHAARRAVIAEASRLGLERRS